MVPVAMERSPALGIPTWHAAAGQQTYTAALLSRLEVSGGLVPNGSMSHV